MSKHNLPHRLVRQNFTREQQKERIMTVFYTHYAQGDFRPLTAQCLANTLRVISAQYVKEICRELCSESLLVPHELLHSKRKNGTQIWKTVFSAWDVEVAKHEYYSAANLSQKRLIP